MIPQAACARLRARAETSGALLAGESYVAAIDESWLDDGARGTVLTDRRILRFRRERATVVVALGEVARVRVRRMWYPVPPLLGRGDAYGKGPVVILRLRLELRSGARARLRLQDFAGELRPFVEALLARFPDLEVARTLPGI